MDAAAAAAAAANESVGALPPSTIAAAAVAGGADPWESIVVEWDNALTSSSKEQKARVPGQVGSGVAAEQQQAMG
jgi:hypothetical protein